MRKVALIVLDGWGLAPAQENNAISKARTPFFDHLWSHYPKTTLQASGKFVGLPEKQIGGSEVGHLTMGAGRIILQDLPRINKGLFEPESDYGVLNLDVFSKFVSQAKKHHPHLVGCVSPGGVHSHYDHLFALLKLLKKLDCKEPYIHFIADGRDTMPHSGKQYAQDVLQFVSSLSYGKVVTLIGRYYAMDRDTNWDRTQIALDLYFQAEGKTSYGMQKDFQENLLNAIEHTYRKGNDDEFIDPMILDSTFHGIQENEPVFFFNFRTDRMKQIVKKTLELHPHEGTYTMTRYDNDFDAQVLYEKQTADNTLGEILMKNELSQLKAAETEKGAHVTYFFNGGKDVTFQHEIRTIEQSNRVKHDVIPEMKVNEIVKNVKSYTAEEHPDFILVNFANPDMVGHTGNFQAVIDGVEQVDRQLKALCDYLTERHYVCCITSDHGNAEIMYDLGSGEKHTAHTLSPVPFIIYDPIDETNQMLALSTDPENGLSKIAGTVAHLIDPKLAPDFESLIV